MQNKSISTKFRHSLMDEPQDVFRENEFYDINERITNRAKLILTSNRPSIRRKGSKEPLDDDYFFEYLNMHKIIQDTEQNLSEYGLICL